MHDQEVNHADNGRRFRALRIAFAAACAVTCILLIALWVRSHFVIEGIVRHSHGPLGSTITLLGSNYGTFQITRGTYADPRKLGRDFPEGWSYLTAGRDDATDTSFIWARHPEGIVIQFPILLPVLCIAFTLGLLAYMARK